MRAQNLRSPQISHYFSLLLCSHIVFHFKFHLKITTTFQSIMPHRRLQNTPSELDNPLTSPRLKHDMSANMGLLDILAPVDQNFQREINAFQLCATTSL